MSTNPPDAAGRPLRLWPGLALAAVVVVLRYVAPLVLPGMGMVAALGGAAGGVLIVLWWLLLSRAPWRERALALLVVAAAALVTFPLLHVSLRDGMMGMLFSIYGIPALALALVAWAAMTHRLPPAPRRAALVAAALLACAPFLVLRTDGISGDGGSDFRWRWTPTAEETLLAEAAPEPAAPTAAAPPTTVAAAAVPEPSPSATAPRPPTPSKPAEWPGFRGPARDGVVRGVHVATDWASSPPTALWRQPIGPGWSSFAVDGRRIYTQEQRGEDEVVSCYDLATGKPVWRHRDRARFWESNAGAGPRSTPAVVDGRVYTLGATGIVNSLEASTGAVVWSRNASADTGAKLPGWGFAASPLVVDDLVVVATAGTLAAYDVVTGAPRWIGPKGGGGYSSPHLVTLDGVPQVLLLSRTGATAVSPRDGKELWRHEVGAGTKIVQPAVTPDGDLLVHEGDSSPLRRLAVTRGGGAWTATERWSSDGLKPYFSDFVVHEGHAYGFDGRLLSAIDLATGERKWKGGRYGNGQLVLLADQDLLLVLSEDGELALVGAKPDGFEEVARVPGIEGKTWNHPVLVGDTLLVRNGEQMAAFRLARAASTASAR